jgi:hypothetical protein
MSFPVRRASFRTSFGCLLFAVGCGSDAEAAGEADQDPPAAERSCVDADGDGFGVDCKAGADCDDADDTVFEDCSPCSQPDEGCPCAGAEQPVMCKLDPVQVPSGSLLCKDGMRYCRDGAWTDCMGVATFD